MSTIGVGIIGCGGIALQNHLPGLELCADTRLVGLCDNSAEVLEKAVQQTGAPVHTTDYNELVQRDDIHAVGGGARRPRAPPDEVPRARPAEGVDVGAALQLEPLGRRDVLRLDDFAARRVGRSGGASDWYAGDERAARRDAGRDLHLQRARVGRQRELHRVAGAEVRRAGELDVLHGR